MSESHGVDPRASEDPRNRYPTDEEFYTRDRPGDAVLPEDRPRGGGGSGAERVRHRGSLFLFLLIAFLVLFVIVLILAFP